MIERQTKNNYVEFRIKNKNGGVRWIGHLCQPVYSNNGDFKGIRGSNRDITEQKVIESTLYFISQKAQSDTGQIFYDNITKYLTNILNIEFAFIGKLMNKEQKVKVISINKLGKPQPNFQYDLENTPCNNVMSREICIYKSGITKLFPKDEILIDLKADSYAGVPLFDTTNTPIGLIGIIGTKEIKNPKIVKTILNLLTVTVSHEMEHNKMIQAIEKSEIQLKEAQQIAKIGYWTYNYTENKLFWSDEIYKLFNLKHQNITTLEAFSSIIHPDDKEMVNKAFVNARKQKKPVDIEHRLLLENNQLRYVKGTVQIKWDESEIPLYAFGTVQDITDNIKKRQELEKANNRYKKLASITFGGIAIVHNETIIEINNQFANILGYSVDEIINTPITNYVLHNDKALVKKYIYENYEERYVIKMVKKDGSIIIIDTKNKFEEIENEKMHLTVIRDITEQKQNEKIILNAIINTEEKERKRFAEDLHDELGPHLSSARLYVNELESSSLDYNKRKEITTVLDDLIKEAIEKIRTISSQLMPNILSDYGLIKALQSFCNRINNTNTVKITFTTKIWDNNILNKTSGIIIYRIITELINNTIKYAKAQNIIITFNQNNDVIELTYKDDGKGFDLNQKIEDRKGLGLNNILNRLKVLDGKYDFKSVPEKGIVFNFRLPISDNH